jgi:EmrB/QacA subfamily drug resistance transporter
MHSSRRGHPWLTLIAVALGVMMVAIDGTVVSVANPTIGHDLDASLAGLQWVTNAYLLALAVLLVVGGKLGDRYGRKLIFSIGITGFALASLGCALSGSIETLVLFRIVQGVAGALLMPNTLAILRATFPPQQLDRAVGIWGGTTALATASGPIIGGLLVEHVSWQSIFLINLPLGLAALVTTLLVVVESRDRSATSALDLPGVGLLTGALFCVVWGLIKSQAHGWGSVYTLAFLVGGIALLAAFALRESRTREPLIPMRLFHSRALSAGVVLVILALFVLFGVLFFVTLYLQRVHGYSPIEAGVRVLPLTGVFALSAPLGGVLTGRFGPRLPLTLGMTLLGVAMLGLRSIGVDTAYSGLWPWFLLIGIGLGLVIVASTQAIVGNAPVDLGGVAGGLQTTANQLGGVLGTAVLGSVLASRVGSTLFSHLTSAGVPDGVAHQLAGAKEAVAQGIAPPAPPGLAEQVLTASQAAFLDGLHAAILVGAVLAFVGAGLGLLVNRGEAQAVAGVPAPAPSRS